MTQSSSNLLTIADTFIESDVGAANPSVQRDEIDTIIFVVNLNIDQSLFGSGFRFDCNFQIIRVGDLSVVSNNWLSRCLGFNYPVIVENFFANSGANGFFISNQASNFGINGGNANNAESNNTGLYILRVYMFVDTSQYGQGGGGFPSLGFGQGTSQWAVSDDIYFWCEV